MNQRSGVSGWIGRVSPMHAEYVELAAEDAWRRMLDFFALHLSAGMASVSAPAANHSARAAP